MMSFKDFLLAQAKFSFVKRKSVLNVRGMFDEAAAKGKGFCYRRL